MKFFLILVLFYAVYNVFTGNHSINTNDALEVNISNGVSARQIDPSCDVILFTTSSCGYCKQARNLLINKDIAWCEKDINTSNQNYKVFKSLGGKGVPVAVIGYNLLLGYSQEEYKEAIDQI